VVDLAFRDTKHSSNKFQAERETAVYLRR